MQYIVIDGFRKGTSKKGNELLFVWGRKLKNDYSTNHGHEMDTVMLSPKIIQLTDDDLNAILDVEFNSKGYVINAKVIKSK